MLRKLLNKKKNAFTIVELVIVIAVIAVLAAVLIPTFISLTNKANKASDQALVKNLNTALATQEQVSGDTKNNTMHDAVEDLKDYGYLLPNLVTKSSDKLLWDRTSNRFLLEEDAVGAKKLDYWRIQDNLDEQVYNVYAGAKFAIDDAKLTALTVGFDAGYTEGIESIQYLGNGVSAQEVVIRTNGFGTVLTVNAPNDTVHHYDYLDELTITKIASASYHEYGTIRGKATISQGHIAVEKGASLPEVDVKAATGAVKVTANESTLVSVDSASAAQTDVVANSGSVYVTGLPVEKISGSEASKVELPTVVTTESQLAAALVAKKAFIQLGANFTAENIYEINAVTLIDFAGYIITATKVGTTQEQYAAAITAMTEGFAFNNTPFLTNNSTLTLTDTKGNGGISSSNNIVILNKSSLNVNGVSISSTIQIHKYYSGRGTYDATKAPSTWELSNAQNDYRVALNSTIKRGVIRNEAAAKLTISAVNLYTKSDYGVLNYGDAVINGGAFTSDSSSTNGGYAYCVTNNNIMTINGGTVLGDHGAIAGNAGSLVINNVTAKAKQFYGVYAAGEVDVASAIINNGVFESEKQSAVLVGNSSDGGNGLPANVTINNGTFKGSTVSGSNAAVRTSTVKGGGTYGLGFVTINGGKFNTNVSNATGVHTCVKGFDDLWVVNA